MELIGFDHLVSYRDKSQVLLLRVLGNFPRGSSEQKVERAPLPATTSTALTPIGSLNLLISSPIRSSRACFGGLTARDHDV